MTSLPERRSATGRAARLRCGRLGPAEGNRRAGVGLRCAVLHDRPFDLRAGVTVASAPGRRFGEASRIHAHLDQGGRRMRNAFDRGERRRGLSHEDGRFPDRLVEEVFEGAPLLDVNPEVGFAAFDDELRRGAHERRADPLDGQVRRLLLLAARWTRRGSDHQQTGQPDHTTPHTVRTRGRAVRPGQEASLGIG